MNADQRESYLPPYDALSAIAMALCLAAFVLLGVVTATKAALEVRRLQREARNALSRRLRYLRDESEVLLGAPIVPEKAPTPFPPTYAMGTVSGTFHIFLSHVWGTGQDQMRIVKQRLLEMLPDARVFLDVDDLKEGKGAEYVDVSAVSLVLCTAGYFQSPNCMREILRAVVTGKPIVALLEPEAKHGGLKQEEIRAQLLEADGNYVKWGLAKEVESWGFVTPTAAVLFAALFAREPIEWNRIGALSRSVSRHHHASRIAKAKRPRPSLHRQVPSRTCRCA